MLQQHRPDGGPDQYSDCYHPAEQRQGLIEGPFPAALIIPQQGPADDASQQAAAMSPVVDPRKDQPEYEQADHPAADLAVDGTAVGTAPAFAVVEQGADQAADRGRGTDGEGHAGQVGDQKADDAPQGIDAEHAAAAVFGGYPWRDLFQGHQVEHQMDDAAVQVVGADQGPVTAELVNRKGTGGPQAHQSALTRGEQSANASQQE